MTPTERVQKLEALLERVRRNRTVLPRRTSATVSTPIALEGVAAPAPFVPATPPAPAAAATPPMPPAAPAPSPPAPPTMASAPDVLPPTTPGWQPEPGSAVQPRPETLAPESIPAEEISDDDLLEVTTIPPGAEESAPPAPAEPAPAAAAAPAQPSFTEPDEPELIVSEPPAAERPVVEPPELEPDTMEVSEITAVGVRVSAATLDEALAGAAELEGEALEGEHDVPIKTPPPESGPQEALPPTGLEAGRTPDVTELEADLMSPPSMGPTAEQLGETIELEAPRGPELEIDVTIEEPAAASHEPAPAEELEVALPRPSMQSGLYDVTAPPPAQYPDPALAEGPPSVAEPRETATIPVEVPSIDSPARMARPALGATDVANVSLAQPTSSRSFVELLDASLLA